MIVSSSRYSVLLHDRFIDEASVVFGPYDSSDSWGTEDPRMVYNHADQLYYMAYTAY